MSFSETYDDFCKTAESLLQVMQMEEQYLKDTRLTQLDSLLQKKSELFKSNQHYADQILDPTCWKQLMQSQQQNVNQLLQSVTNAMKQNLDLLDLSSRGNKKLMDLYFNKVKFKPASYTAFGKLFETSYAPSLGVQHIV
jgi:small-conductance mechanosensitive channel